MAAIRVYLVDDHVVLRQGIRVMLESEAGIAVVGEASDGKEGLHGIATAKPDVAIVDLKMPGTSGLQVIPQITALSPGTRVVVFTMYNNPSYVYEAIDAGAAGYVLKSVTREELLRAIRAVHGGNTFLQAEITKPLLRRLARQERMEAETRILSPREIQMLEDLAEGLTNKEIGQRLAISDETVKVHLRRVYEKLGARDRSNAVAIALRQNLIE
jgi:DNA-binding NarL/FixJ family response regulator